MSVSDSSLEELGGGAVEGWSLGVRELLGGEDGREYSQMDSSY